MNTANAKHRKHLDQYFTPAWAVEAFLHVCPGIMGTIKEPCAGAGHIARVLAAWGYTVRAFEYDETIKPLPGVGRIEYGQDFLSRESASSHLKTDWTITNPPYTLRKDGRLVAKASDFIRQALTNSDNVAALLPLSWLEPCGDRTDLLARLDEVYVLANPRVQFYGSGNANPGQSVWCVWRKDAPPMFPALRYIPQAICDKYRRDS